MVFIDGGNLYQSLRGTLKRTDLDYQRFVEAIAADRQLQRTYFYTAAVDQALQPEVFKAQQQFLTAIQSTPYFEVKLGRLVYRNWPGQPPIEKGIDVRLATDMLTRAYRDHFDVAVLVSGDNDFVDLVQAVKDQGKHVEVALFRDGGASLQLRNAADRVIEIDAAFLANCWRKK